MKKMLFLMLFLIILGAANVTSQVRIGGNGQPNGAAVLDLNATDAINNGTKGLALPRVSLTDINAALTGSPTINGMIVYNTGGSLSTGVYYWDTNKWVKVSDGSFSEGDGIVGNELTDTIPDGGLDKTGAGTTGDPYKVGIKQGGVTARHLSGMGASSGQVLKYNGSSWEPQRPIRATSHYVTCAPCATLSDGAVYVHLLDDSTWWKDDCGLVRWVVPTSGYQIKQNYGTSYAGEGGIIWRSYDGSPASPDWHSWVVCLSDK